MCMLLVHVAHEIAGAARIRHSLRPLNREGETICKTSGASRRENANLYLRHPRATAKPLSLEARKSAHLWMTGQRTDKTSHFAMQQIRSQPLLTGNGVSISFSVLVAYKHRGRAGSAKISREETCGN